MISERLMASGGWSIQLNEQTPKGTVLQDLDIQTALFGLLVITASPIKGISELSAAQVKARAAYIGVLTKRPDALTLEGQSPLITLGDPDGIGEVLASAVTFAGETAITFVPRFFPSTFGISAGTNYGPSSLLTASVPAGTNRRKAIETVLSAVGGEYRITVNSSGGLVFDTGASGADLASLWGGYPTALISPEVGGRGAGYVGLQALEHVVSHDGETWLSHAYALARADGGVTIGTWTNGTNPYYGPSGNQVQRAITVDAPSVSSSSANTAAASAAITDSSVRRQFRCTVLASDVSGKTGGPSGFAHGNLQCGDQVYLYAPQYNVRDNTKPVNWRGETIFPEQTRCVGIDWPVLEGMGVYFITPEASPRVIDLSRHYVPESGDATLILGAQDRVLNPVSVVNGGMAAGLTLAPGVFGSSYSEGMPASLVSDAWPTFNPTLTQSGAVGKTNTYTKVRRIGRTIIEQGYLTCDGTGAPVGANAITVSTSTTAVQAGALPVGTALIIDASTGNYYRATAHMLTTGTIGFMSTNTNTGAYLGANDFVAALANGDVVAYEITYEAATS